MRRLLGARHRTGGLLGLLAAAVLAAVLLGGSGSGGAQARAGSVSVTGAYLPEPASPDVASVYLRLANDGDQPDELRGATTDAGRSVRVMREQPDGTMQDLGALPLPAHRTVALVPGQQHLMVDAPRAGLRPGQTVTVVLDLARAGRLPVAVPVLPLGARP